MRRTRERGEHQTARLECVRVCSDQRATVDSVAITVSLCRLGIGTKAAGRAGDCGANPPWRVS